MDEDLLGGGWWGVFVGSFDEFAVVESGAGADERNEVGCVHGAPTGLGGFDEFEGHGEAGRAGAGAFGDLCAMAHGGESGLNGYLECSGLCCPC